MNATEKYLSRYAEPEAGALQADGTKYQRVLVVPAFREGPELLGRLQALAGTCESLLVILVINRPETAEIAAGAHLAAAIAERLPKYPDGDGYLRYALANAGCLLTVDRYSSGCAIPPRQGVGLARKIGCDMACRLIELGCVNSPWIFSSDADVLWPPDFFKPAIDIDKASALSFPFRHVSSREHDALPVQLYEFSLHYYVLGLAWAGSPYAHHSLGSALAVDYRHYARVRGFPRRAAGEDFYLLNKLAKSARIHKLASPVLPIVDRPSDRVPFGTGPATTRIAALTNPLNEFPLYAPECFVALRRWLAVVNQLAQSPAHSSQLWGELAAADDNGEHAILEAMGAAAAIDHARRHAGDSAGFRRHLQQWFDGFRTLKFIHALRQANYPSVPITILLRTELPMLPPLAPCPSGRRAQADWLMACNQLLAERIFGAEPATDTLVAAPRMASPHTN